MKFEGDNTIFKQTVCPTCKYNKIFFCFSSDRDIELCNEFGLYKKVET